MSFRIRAMQAADLAAVFQVQMQTYVPAMVEAPALLAARLQAAPATAWVAQDRQGVAAYLVAYPSRCGKIAALGQPFQVAADANALYLHDLAVAPRLAGRGAGGALARQAWQYAGQMGWRYSCLVSVQDTRAFWQQLGYREPGELSAQQQAGLQSYSGQAYYLVKDL